MLSIRNLSKTYKAGKKAVDGLSLEIADGDIYGFIGHNGAGKTTTIKCVTGILDFNDGERYVDNISVKDNAAAAKRLMAYVPDSPDLYENMTGIRYLNFISDIFGVSKADRTGRISKYADAFELTGDLGSVISSYSHGMKQKLTVISALVHEPRLLVLDEPFVGLDPKAAHTLKEIMREACKNGVSIFFSTHVLDVAEKLCTKIAIIKDGRLIISGDTDKVKGESSLESIFLELIDK
jgi:ABC-2 type transport system ATP-binding protein